MLYLLSFEYYVLRINVIAMMNASEHALIQCMSYNYKSLRDEAMQP